MNTGWFLLIVIVVMAFAALCAGVAVMAARVAHRAEARVAASQGRARIAERRAREWARQAAEARNTAIEVTLRRPAGEPCPIDGEPLRLMHSSEHGRWFIHQDGSGHGDRTASMVEPADTDSTESPAEEWSGEEVLLNQGDTVTVDDAGLATIEPAPEPGAPDPVMAGRLLSGLRNIGGQLPEPPAESSGPRTALDEQSRTAGIPQLGWRPKVYPSSAHPAGVILVADAELSNEELRTNLLTLTLPELGRVAAVHIPSAASGEPMVVRRLEGSA